MTRGRRAFSLIELVLVVVIIGIIAAIAIPRMSRGASGSRNANLTANLDTLRRAIELYRVEHNNVPPALTMIVADLTLYSNSDGSSAQGNADATHPFGPYLRSIPALPVGAFQGATGIGSASGASVGWIYDETTGDIHAGTTTETDDGGQLYSAY
jgi:prepilin-type N-terminal cleavage/methylation domain-containing protein